MKVIFVCGGSAGHINPALAIAAEMRRIASDSEILFIGADKKLEKKLVPAAGFELVNIKMSGLRRGFYPKDIVHNIKTAINLITANRKSKAILKDFKPDAVIGTGGYISYPVIKRAARLGIPTFLLEPNAYPGLAVRMLSGVVDTVFVTYKDLENHYKRPERVLYTGTPLRSEFFETDEVSKTDEHEELPLVISYWGSLGAAKMNDIIIEFIKLNSIDGKFRHIHATGVSISTEKTISRLNELGISEISTPFIDVREYIDNMPSTMKSADLIISRAGASTIAELTSLGKPAILIPSPNVTENHQEANAKQLQNTGGAIMILERDCSGKVLYESVLSLLDDREKLKRMSESQESLAEKNAASNIVEEVIKRCNPERLVEGTS